MSAIIIDVFLFVCFVLLAVSMFCDTRLGEVNFPETHLLATVLYKIVFVRKALTGCYYMSPFLNRSQYRNMNQ